MEFDTPITFDQTSTFNADVDFDTTQMLLPSLSGSQFNLQHWSELSMNFTNDPTSARTDAGVAMTMHLRRINNKTQMSMHFGNLGTNAAAVATARFVFVETIPALYRPAVQSNVGLQLVANGAVTNGAINIGTGGTFTIGVGGGSINFVITQVCGCQDQVMGEWENVPFV